jgi:low affinity Fe/Cu permease
MSKRPRGKLANWFENLSGRVTQWTGSTAAFGCALGIVALWGLLGPVFHYSDTWQLVINTGTTIVTFLMVFLIQR